MKSQRGIEITRQKWSPSFPCHVGFCNVIYCSAVLQSPSTPECGMLDNSCFHVKLPADACSTPVYINKYVKNKTNENSTNKMRSERSKWVSWVKKVQSIFFWLEVCKHCPSREPLPDEDVFLIRPWQFFFSLSFPATLPHFYK